MAFRRLVHRVISRRHTVGFKRVWMRGVSEEHISSAIRNERTTMQTDPFQVNPLGRGQLADFLRCSLLTYRFDMLVVRALKISQLTDGGMPPTYDSMHQCIESLQNEWFRIKSRRYSPDFRDTVLRKLTRIKEIC